MSTQLASLVSRHASALAFIILSANAQFGPYDGNDNNNNNNNGPWQFGPGNNNGNGNEDNGQNAPFGSFSGASYQSLNKATIAHGVIACLVWAVFIPFGGILLRLNIQSPWVLRLHAFLQVFSYLCYIAAAGIGIWLARSLSYAPYATLWNNPHVQLGLAILVLAFFQPILGAVHHGMFKSRTAQHQAGKSDKLPGRTIPGYMHLWLGRILIVLGMVNGGLGLRLARQVPFGSYSQTVVIIYSVIAGVIFLVYLISVVFFEISMSKRHRQNNSTRAATIDMHDTPPTYVQSQESLQKDHAGVTRYS